MSKRERARPCWRASKCVCFSNPDVHDSAECQPEDGGAERRKLRRMTVEQRSEGHQKLEEEGAAEQTNCEANEKADKGDRSASALTFFRVVSPLPFVSPHLVFSPVPMMRYVSASVTLSSAAFPSPRYGSTYGSTSGRADSIAWFT